MEHDAPARDDQRPEVEAALPLEGHVHRHVQLDHVVPGDPREGGARHVHGQAELDGRVGRALHHPEAGHGGGGRVSVAVGAFTSRQQSCRFPERSRNHAIKVENFV